MSILHHFRGNIDGGWEKVPIERAEVRRSVRDEIYSALEKTEAVRMTSTRLSRLHSGPDAWLTAVANAMRSVAWTFRLIAPDTRPAPFGATIWLLMIASSIYSDENAYFPLFSIRGLYNIGDCHPSLLGGCNSPIWRLGDFLPNSGRPF